MKPKDCKGCQNLNMFRGKYYCQYTRISEVATCFRLTLKKKGGDQ